MPEMIFWLLVLATLRAVRAIAALRERPKAPAQSLCIDCASAHVQYAVNGKRAISCTFGGGVRPVGMDVLYCTDYCNRNAPRRVVTIGFAPERNPAQLAEAAGAR
jgi:hypothetical protein